MSDLVTSGGSPIHRPDGLIATGCGSGGPCSNQCVVEFEVNYYDCTGWDGLAPTGAPTCGVPDVAWIEDPADCLRMTKRVLTNPPKCCTNSANCSTTTASAPDVMTDPPPCADSVINCDVDCCQVYTVSIVGGCYAGTYDLDYIGSCQWAYSRDLGGGASVGCIFLRCSGSVFGIASWEVIVDGCVNPACDGTDPSVCELHFEVRRGCCDCPPTGTYSLDTSLNDPPLPYGCGSPSVTVSRSACP
jgi:hypothetical protein